MTAKRRRAAAPLAEAAAAATAEDAALGAVAAEAAVDAAEEAVDVEGAAAADAKPLRTIGRASRSSRFRSSFSSAAAERRPFDEARARPSLFVSHPLDRVLRARGGSAVVSAGDHVGGLAPPKPPRSLRRSASL